MNVNVNVDVNVDVDVDVDVKWWLWPPAPLVLLAKASLQSEPTGTARLSGYDGDFRGVYVNANLADGVFRQYPIVSEPVALHHLRSLFILNDVQIGAKSSSNQSINQSVSHSVVQIGAKSEQHV